MPISFLIPADRFLLLLTIGETFAGKQEKIKGRLAAPHGDKPSFPYIETSAKLKTSYCTRVRDKFVLKQAQTYPELAYEWNGKRFERFEK